MKTKLKIEKAVPKKDERKVSYFQLFRYATLQDKIFIALGTICSVVCGVIQPYVMILFGGVTGVIVDYAAAINKTNDSNETQLIEETLYDGELLDLTSLHKPVQPLYAVEELAAAHNVKILRTPPYHCELNPIEMIWAQVKGYVAANNKTFKLEDDRLLLEKGIQNVTPERWEKQEMEAYGTAGSIAEEVLSSVRTVVAFDGQEKEITRYEKHLQSGKRNNITKNLFSGISNGFMWFFVYASYALSFWYGIGLILEERYLPQEEITYTPANMVAILRSFNLDIKSGETVALVGSSGCGKSTCIQLMQRFYDATSGSVTIDDNNITKLNLTWLRNKIGVVGQEPALFAATIADNIKYGNLSATQDDIEKAAKKANAHNFIKTLPRGYNTLIGERGAQISGGQKQRIAIARALICEPKILLLDEATSALDTTSEGEVQAALDAISGECTTIIVAHRLSTIRNADRIVVLSDGKVIEEGNHAQLMAEKGAYHSLLVSHGLRETEDVFTEDKEVLNGISNVAKVSETAMVESASEEKLQLGLASECKNEQSPIGTWLKHLFGLTFLPPAEVGDCFAEDFMCEKPENSKLDQFADYLVDNYTDTELPHCPSRESPAARSPTVAIKGPRRACRAHSDPDPLCASSLAPAPTPTPLPT
ncbi:hypothetical protein GEV33_000384 [Tenebrio molitor]|uniref:Uncharacterized protein n=1 Tax=Tenebrio molitor TaxID=7067 RepID=A0A8J6HXM1_TENMO|nr:hypothetical protein GEV33_000384 [Tenebrio molitor]